MHGKELGLGVLLHQILPVPSVTQTFATSVQLSFDQASKERRASLKLLLWSFEGRRCIAPQRRVKLPWKVQGMCFTHAGLTLLWG